MIEAPAPATDAEQQIDDCADGQQQIADKEILAILHAACADELQVAPDIEAEDAGHAEHQHGNAADKGGLFAADAEGIHREGQEILKHGQHRGEAGKGHEQEEQGAPQAAALHIDENAGERLEDEGGSGIRLDTIGEAGREDDDAGHNGHKGIQGADAGGLAGEGVLPAHVASKDLHGGDAETEGKEGLIHGGGDDIPQAVGTDAFGGGEQVEFHALGGAGQQQAVHRQHNNEGQQGDHHDLGDALEAFLHAKAANQKAHNDHDDHKDGHFSGGGEHLAVDAADLLGAHAGDKIAPEEFIKVIHHPTGDGGVVHHKQAAAQHAEPAVDVPLLARLFEGLVGLYGAFAAGAAHGQLHGHNRDAHDDQADEIKQHKVSAAVLAGDIGEAPDIADADGAAGTDQQEP